MEVVLLIGKILLVLLSLGVIVLVLMQSGKGDGLSGLAGGSAETFFARNKSKTLEAKLSRLTYIGGGAIIVLSIALVLLGKLAV